jgi:hypothetical protein
MNIIISEEQLKKIRKSLSENKDTSKNANNQKLKNNSQSSKKNGN